MSTKKKTVSKAKKETDGVFSKYIRLKYADPDGFVSCITCGLRKRYKDGMQAGHYVTRTCNQLRYSEKNVYPQCIGCNLFKEGVKDTYALFLIDNFTVKRLRWLAKEKQKTRQFTVSELEEMWREFKSKLPADALKPVTRKATKKELEEDDDHRPSCDCC